MKREDITKLFPDATKDQIDQILNINGADIAKAKGEAEKAKGDLDTYRADLETAQKRIQELEKAGNDLQAAKGHSAGNRTERTEGREPDPGHPGSGGQRNRRPDGAADGRQ